jgi:hypothetical protein
VVSVLTRNCSLTYSPITWEAEAGGSLEPRRWRPVWAI